MRIRAVCARVQTTSTAAAALAAASMLLFGTAGATDIFGVQDGALDQPRVNLLLRSSAGGPPLSGIDPISGDPSFNIQAFLDTGASGVLLSKETADVLGVTRTPGVTYEDIGIGGSSQFQVSQPLFVGVAPFTPSLDINNEAAYNQGFGPLRAQVKPDDADFLVGPLDVVGMPVMQNKVVVMDPKPVDTLGDLMRTYLYNPGTPFRPATADSDPGIPATNRSVALTYASFSQFSRLTPANAEGPTQSPNPFIGPNPLAKIDPNVPAGSVPGIKLKLGNKEATGSFLLDTGAQASIISKDMAAQLGVRERPGTPAGSAPVLERFDPAHPELPGTELPEQFLLTLSGIGGDQTAAGFFLDSLLVRTTQGNAANDNDPHHLRYIHAPVLVADITLMDPLTLKTLTLDGVFAMNFLVASIFVSEPLTLGDTNPSPYDWIVFDQQAALLGLNVAAIPEPVAFIILLVGVGLVGARLRKQLTPRPVYDPKLVA
jgi:hypothetical protein